MQRCVTLCFILIVMTYHSCDHFGNDCWQSSSTRWIDRYIFPLPLGRSQRIFVWKGRLTRNNAESVRIGFLDANLTCNVVRISLYYTERSTVSSKIFFFRWSSGSNVALTLSSTWRMRISCTYRSVLKNNNIKMCVPYHYLWELQFLVHIGQDFWRVPQRIVVKILYREFNQGKSMFLWSRVVSHSRKFSAGTMSLREFLRSELFRTVLREVLTAFV